MVSFFYDAASGEDKDSVGAVDCGQAVGYCEGGSAGGQFIQGF